MQRPPSTHVKDNAIDGAGGSVHRRGGHEDRVGVGRRHAVFAAAEVELVVGGVETSRVGRVRHVRRCWERASERDRLKKMTDDGEER